MSFRCLALFVFFPVWINSLSAITPDPSFRSTCDSILALNADKQITYVKTSSAKPVYVFAATCKTLPYSMASVRKALTSIDDYQFMSLMTRIEHLGVEPMGGRRQVYFIEAAGSFMAKTWYLGTFDTSRVDPNTGCAIRFDHYDDSALAVICKEKVKAWIRVDYRDFSIGWRLRETGPHSTRVELVSYLSLYMWIPQWLYDLTAKMIFPGVVQDLEKHLQRTGAR